MPTRTLGTRRILAFWLPLAITWLMMSVEGPYVAAIIARLPEAAFNLAAYGVAFSLAWLVESPIMMLLSAANTLVRDRASFVAMRRFMHAMVFGVTAIMLLCALPPVFALAARLMDLPMEVARLTHLAMVVLIVWPGAIGYRRFYQGVLISHHMPRRVTYGTVVRLGSMSVAGAVLALATPLNGAMIGAAALGTGVVAEAIASRWMARHIVNELLASSDTVTPRLTQRAITRYYYPLALTSVISMATGPLLTFFMGRGRFPVESLAVLPVVQSVLFVFRSGGVAFQDVGVALSGRQHEHEREVGRTSLLLALTSSAALACLLFTPLAGVWLELMSGLSPHLAGFALSAARVLVLLPALEYWLSFQRSRYIINGQTSVVTIASAIEVAGIALVLVICISGSAMTGAIAASIATIAGRLAANAFLLGKERRRYANR